MKYGVLAIALVALGALVDCAATSVEPKRVALPETPHVQTASERKTEVCARHDLVPLAPALLGSATHIDENAPVRSVRVRDSLGATLDVRSDVTNPVAIGFPLSVASKRAVVSRIWEMGNVADVAIDTENVGDGIAVVFIVTKARTISNVFLSGEASSDALSISAGNYYAPVAIASAVRSALEVEHKNGYTDASLVVSSAFADVDHTAVDVCISLTRGPLVTIGSVTIHGSAFDQVLAEILAHEDALNVPGKVVNEELLARDELVLAAKLYDHGLLSHVVKRQNTRSGALVAIDFAITDGPTFHYGIVNVRGDLLVPKIDYMKLITLKQGDVFDRSAVMVVLDKIRALHKTQGREDIEVSPATDLDTQTSTVALTIDVEDPQKRQSIASPGFLITELAKGHGTVVAKKGDKVSVHYKGTLTNGTVFDDSHSRGPFEFTIGKGQVIKGFDQGVLGMKIGQKRRVKMPPDMAYGTRGTGNIPAGSTLVFEIELVSIQ